MWLKDLIGQLEKLDPETPVARGFSEPHSYRGYYEQLAFEPESNTTVGAMLACAMKALGATYTGYKGGEFTMDDYTSVWVANYGTEGHALSRLLLEYLLQDDRPW